MRIMLTLTLLAIVCAGLLLMFARARKTEAPQQAATLARAAPRPLRPVNTYSIVARDPATGQLGVAVQSHWFSVGSIVSWAEPGVGAVATQAFAEPAYGPRGLTLMRDGVPAPEAL